MDTYSISGWENFQHYKKRNPPWVKLHGSMLTSVAWLKGSDLIRSIMTASILLAARYHNAVPLDMDILRPAAGLKCTDDEFHQALAFLEQCDFITISRRKPRASTAQASRMQTDSKTLVSEEESRGRGEEVRSEETPKGVVNSEQALAEKPPLALVAANPEPSPPVSGPPAPAPKPVDDFDPVRDMPDFLVRRA